MFDIRVVEHCAYMYLRSVSFNSIVAINQSWFEKKVFSKQTLLRQLEELSDKLPSLQDITRWLKPRRSGYYALDGTWLKYQGEDIVLLILFDVETLDVVSYLVAKEENEKNYQRLILSAREELLTENGIVKGFFCDGDPGLLKTLKSFFPGKPIQLCVFHKYSRVGQIIPMVYLRKEIDKEIKRRVEAVLFASSKTESCTKLGELERYAQEHQSYEKLQKIIGVLKRNFDLLLTHFDNPQMSAYNNVLEGFNYIVKRKTRLMKGFKKEMNIDRWLKLILVDWRFHELVESEFKTRKNKSPLELAGCKLPKIYNWMKFVRENYQ